MPFLEVWDIPPIDLSSGDWWVLVVVYLLTEYLKRRFPSRRV